MLFNLDLVGGRAEPFDVDLVLVHFVIHFLDEKRSLGLVVEEAVKVGHAFVDRQFQVVE